MHLAVPDWLLLLSLIDVRRTFDQDLMVTALLAMCKAVCVCVRACDLEGMSVCLGRISLSLFRSLARSLVRRGTIFSC